MKLFDFGPEQTVWQDISALVSMVLAIACLDVPTAAAIYSLVKSVIVYCVLQLV